jgi:hypothetical protein
MINLGKSGININIEAAARKSFIDRAADGI